MKLEQIAKYGDENMVIISIPSIQKGGVTWTRGEFFDFYINNRNRLGFGNYLISKIRFLPNGAVLLEYSPAKKYPKDIRLYLYTYMMINCIECIKEAIFDTSYEYEIDIIKSVSIIRSMFDQINVYDSSEYNLDGLTTLLKALVFYSKKNIDIRPEYFDHITAYTRECKFLIPREFVNTPFNHPTGGKQ